jgi:hypothetical protein
MKDSGLSMQDIQQTIDVQDEFFTKVITEIFKNMSEFF